MLRKPAAAIAALAVLPLAACDDAGPQQGEAETPVVETEVAPTSEADAESLGPSDRSLANEAEDSVTAPAGELDGEIEPYD
jgi:hypothetical protein